MSLSREGFFESHLMLRPLPPAPPLCMHPIAQEMEVLWQESQSQSMPNIRIIANYLVIESTLNVLRYTHSVALTVPCCLQRKRLRCCGTSMSLRPPLSLT
jgi:hypothetical protein